MQVFGLFLYLTSSEWRQLKNDWANSTYPQLRSYSQGMIDYNTNTDWIKEISQNKISQAHNLGFSGGYKKTSCSANLNYDNYNGIIQKTGNKIYGGQISVSQLALKDKLQLDLLLTGASRKFSQINDNPYLASTDFETGQVNSNIISTAGYYNPTVPVYNADGTFGRDTMNDYLLYYYNPLNRIKNMKDERKSENLLASFLARYEIIKGFIVSTSFSEYTTSIKSTFSKKNQIIQDVRLFFQGRNETNDQKEKLYNLKLNYIKSFGNHHFDLLLGYSKQNNDNHYLYMDSIGVYGTTSYSYSSRRINNSYNIRNISGLAKYDYNNKYYLSFNLLQENSNLYKSNKSIQYFPSVLVGWSFGNEEFLKNFNWLDVFIIRAGYGISQRHINNDIFTDGNFVGNRNLHGENMTETNFGVDINLFSNRICFSVDFYNRKTTDGIIAMLIPDFSSFNSILENNFEIQNKGWEFYFKSQPLINPIKWTFNFNISFNKNILLSEINTTNMVKGQPAGNFFGYQFAGYSNSGSVLVYDKNGDTTSQYWKLVNRKIIGNGVPKSYFGFTNNFCYKKFDLSIFVRGASGFEIRNSDNSLNYRNMDYKKEIASVDPRDVINYNNFLTNSDYVIEKGDYVKIDNISLGYSIPLKKGFIKSVKVYFVCNNVAMFTRFKGGDPEMAGITGATPGNYLYEKYPNTRIYVLGLKIIM